MNEIQIIQKQLDTEKAHFAEVAAACSRALTGAAGSDFVTACADYFSFAVTRFEPAVAARLAAMPAVKREFLDDFTAESRTHFEKLDALRTRNIPVTEWRALSRIDADSIYDERARYARVKATIPT